MGLERKAVLRAAPAHPVQYERRRPEESILHGLVREHLATFLAQVEARTGTGLLGFVKDEFEAFLECGILAHGFLLRLASLAHNTRLWPRSTPQSAIGVKHPHIVQIAQGAMGGSFNTREFFHGRRNEVVRAARWLFLALGFPLPALLLVFASSPAALLAAFLVQYAGLLAERWYFFAEARHPQNLYYQAIA